MWVWDENGVVDMCGPLVALLYVVEPLSRWTCVQVNLVTGFVFRLIQVVSVSIETTTGAAYSTPVGWPVSNLAPARSPPERRAGRPAPCSRRPCWWHRT
eukprot:scaffold9072_cov62-Phaeocystis_antarctica.AAC.3